MCRIVKVALLCAAIVGISWADEGKNDGINVPPKPAPSPRLLADDGGTMGNDGINVPPKPAPSPGFLADRGDGDDDDQGENDGRGVPPRPAPSPHYRAA